MRTAAIIAALAAGSVVFGQSPKPVRNPIPTGRGVIAGRVVDALSRQPISGVTVRLEPRGKYAEWAPGIDADPSRIVTTGAGGTFTFDNLGPIEYDVIAWVSGYADGGAGQTWPRGSRAPIRLEQDQRLTAVDIRLWPLAELSGRVLDERGQPLAGVSVSALSEAVTEGRSQFSQYASQALTDERGEYRMTLHPPMRVVLCVSLTYSSYAIPALSPAQRRVAEPATPRAGTPLVPSMLVAPDAKHLVLFSLLPLPGPPDRPSRAYVSTCAPSATSSEEATVVDVPHGRTVAPDLTMQWRHSPRLSGRLVGPDGPLGQTWLRLRPVVDDRAKGFATAQVLTAADGTFTFLIVPPGTYVWDVHVPDPPPTVTPSASGFPTLYHPDYGSGDPNGYWIGEPMFVGAENIEDLVLTPRRGVTVRGRVEVDGPATPPPGVSVNLRRSLDGFDARGAHTTADGRFEIRAVKPGRYGLSVAAAGWTLTGASSGVSDLLDSPLVVGENDVNDLVVRMSSSPAKLTGMVRDSTGTVETAATVVVFPTDTRAWNFILESSPRARSTRAVAGRYTFDGLPPGEYYVAATDDVVMARWTDPALFATLAKTANRVMVQLGEERTMDLVKR